MSKIDNAYYFPWVKKGLGNAVKEIDTLGKVNNFGMAKERPYITIETTFGIKSQDDNEEKITKARRLVKKVSTEKTLQTDAMDFSLVGPGDIDCISENSIMKRVPESEDITIPIQYCPYIEFWEPDFIWRYTPAKPTKENRLRPWLALVACEKSKCKIVSGSLGKMVQFSISNEEEYRNIFIPSSQFWKAGHAQGFNPEDPTFCRLLALRGNKELQPNSEYYALLIPAFETGRLHGIGQSNESLSSIIAQAPSWEDNFETQKNTHIQPFIFPVYDYWSFATSDDSFDTLVEDLSVDIPNQASLKIDISAMGEGMDYNLLEANKVPKRKSIGMPAATIPLNSSNTESFPGSYADEAILQSRLKELLGANPVFVENREELGVAGDNNSADKDDPMVVPPIYGAKHVMSVSLNSEDNEDTPWINQLNLDVHNRAAAGLGKRTVQLYQEQFVNRAWKQADAVRALNTELYKRLTIYNTKKTLRKKILPQKGRGSKYDAKYLATLMQYLNAMRNASSAQNGELTNSLSQILVDSNIPKTFATATFQHLTDSLTTKIKNWNSDTLMENIMNNHIFEAKPLETYNLPNIKQWEVIYKKYSNAYLNEILQPFLGENLDCQKAILPKIELYYRWMGWVENGKIVFPLSKNIKLNPNHYRKIRDFVKNGPAMQFIGLAKVKGKEYKVISIPTEFYKMLFGEKPLTIWTNNNFSTCIVDDEYFLEGRYYGREKDNKNQDNIVYPYIINNIDKYNAESNRQVQLFSIKEPKYCALPFYWGRGMRFVGRGGVPEYFDKYVFSSKKIAIEGIDDSSAIEGIDDSSFEGSKFYEEYKTLGLPIKDISKEEDAEICKYINKLMHYLFKVPDVVNLDLTGLPESDIQSFTLDTYFDFILNNETALSLKWLKGLQEYIKDVNNLIKIKPKDKAVEISSGAVSKLEEDFNDEEAYKRMQKVAETYYSEFYSNSTSGSKLREEYINDLLRSKYPILAYPIFPEPTYYYLKQFSNLFVLPCADTQKDDSVSMMFANPSFIESYLCGMNTEMGKELLWREYPTDQRGSYFRKFWDSETSSDNIKQNEFFDIKPIHLWDGNLGENHEELKSGLIIFAVKGRLMRAFPNTQIFLQRAKKSKNELAFDSNATEKNGGIYRPVLQAYLRNDIYIVGFKVDFLTILGDYRDNDYGYMLSFKEDVEDINFSAVSNEDCDNAAIVAHKLLNVPTIYGKHISLFVK